MFQYERIDISESVDFNGSNKSVGCMICHYWYYWYFKDIGFKYQSYFCNECHQFSIVVQYLDDLVVLKIKGVDYRCHVVNMSKKDAINSLNNSVLDNKEVL